MIELLLVLLLKPAGRRYFFILLLPFTVNKDVWLHNDVYSVYCMVNVLWKETAFPRCKATDSRWNRKPASMRVLCDGWYSSAQLLHYFHIPVSYSISISRPPALSYSKCNDVCIWHAWHLLPCQTRLQFCKTSWKVLWNNFTLWRSCVARRDSVTREDYIESTLTPMTHAPETGAENRLRSSGADFWYVCHSILYRIRLVPDSDAD